MRTEPAQEAIAAALAGDWKKAVEINTNILSEDPDDCDAMNRLARAYCEIGNLKRAKTLAHKVLKIDPFNTIATKSLQKWKTAGRKSENYIPKGLMDSKTFIEESGKTKITSLLHLGDGKTLATLDTGDELKLNPGSHRISVLTFNGSYVGKLTDDLSARLRKLIKMGNLYEVFVKSVEPNNIKIFIREISRSEKLSDTPSFPTEKIDYISFTPPELVHKKERLTPEED